MIFDEKKIIDEKNFQAQTWVEHAIFALRERRLTTWPLRLLPSKKRAESASHCSHSANKAFQIYAYY